MAHLFLRHKDQKDAGLGCPCTVMGGDIVGMCMRVFTAGVTWTEMRFQVGKQRLG